VERYAVKKVSREETGAKQEPSLARLALDEGCSRR
jgi:hypothetical protein